MNEHLAIMRNPWMNYLTSGKKTIESRIYQKRNAPWDRIHQGDTIYFRLSGDFAVTHKATVNDVAQFQGTIIFEKLKQYKTKICIDDDYIESKSKCKYLILMWLSPIVPLGLEVFPFRKRDQRAWICNFEKERKEREYSK